MAVFISVQAKDVATLVITHADGTTTSYELFTRPCINFVGDSVKITSPTVSAEYYAKDVLSFSYKMPTTSIEKTSTGSSLSVDGEYLIFGGKNKTANVKVYSSNGTEETAKFSSSTDGLRLRLSSLRKGIYLINANGRTFKFIKR